MGELNKNGLNENGTAPAGKVLVIDDNAYDVKALSLLLQHAGYQVISAEMGLRGLELAQSEVPDSILLDVQLPDMDGFEVCRSLKDDPRTAEIPVVFLTAHYQDEESLIKGLNLGANDYIRKPFNKAELLARIGVTVRIRKSRKELLRLSFTDEQTGLGNRRFLEERLEEEFERCRRTGQFLAAIMIDIDHFKVLNDTYGTRAGDVVLSELAGILRKQSRKIDVLSRYGGEEFVVLLSVKWPSDAFGVAERIRRAIAAHAFAEGVRGTGSMHVTVSVGVVECLPGGQEMISPPEMIEIADKVLREAKRSGRNCVCRWADFSPEEQERLQAS